MAAQAVQVCNVCEYPVDGRALDPHLGPVCFKCKTGLRWAHFWLTNEKTGIEDCTNKFFYRLNKTKGK